MASFPFGVLSGPTTAASPTSGSGDSRDIDVAYIVIASVICVLGLFGNLVAIFVIVVLKEYEKSVTHWYVLQLAVADTIFLITWPFKLSEYYAGSWDFPEWMCKANETILFLNYYASVLFLVVMSVDRYIAVCRTFSPTLQVLRKRTSAFIIALCIWGMCLTICTPVILHSYKIGTFPKCGCSYEFGKARANDIQDCIRESNQTESAIMNCQNATDRKNQLDNGELHCRKFNQSVLSIFVDDQYDDYEYTSSSGNDEDVKVHNNVENALNENCHYNHNPIGWTIFLSFNFVVMFIVPFLIMLVCYGLIVRRLFNTRMRTTSTSSSVSFTHSINANGSQKRRRKSSARSDKDRRRVTIMCAALVISFMVCWLPFHGIHLAKFKGIRGRENEFCDWLSRIGSVFAYLTAAINPYLYSFLGTHFVKRWRVATTTVRKSMRVRGSTSSGGLGSGRYAQRKPGRENSTSNNPTLMTKINKIDNNAVSESKGLSFGATTCAKDAMQMNMTKDNSSEEGATSGTPPPDYEHSLKMQDDKDTSVFKN